MAKRTLEDSISSEERFLAGPYFYDQPFPSGRVERIDPFLLLHHHGPMTLPPHNSGMPFGPHPHRGFETATFILQGQLVHTDSQSLTSQIDQGGVQWMTAGRGLIHNESVPEGFKENGGDLELLQLWINLPSRLKLTPPHYVGLQKEQIPEIQSEDGGVKVQIVSGHWGDKKGAHQSLTGIDSFLITMGAGGETEIPAKSEMNVLFYQLRGSTRVGGTAVNGRRLVLFKNDGDVIDVESETDSQILFCAGQPLDEPVVSYGPFVMNTQAEILEAMQDYRLGKMGTYPKH